MGSHLDAIAAAVKKAKKEAEKLEKEFLAAKTPQEKEKLKKMAEGAWKIAEAHINQVDAAKAKDKAEMLEIFKKIK